MTEIPDLLTVEEAARYLRIGHTKAYAMTREWRASGGRSGLPVVDLDNVLRVPRGQLEQVIGTTLTGPVPDSVMVPRAASMAEPDSCSSAIDDLSSAPVPVRRNSQRHSRRDHRPGASSSQPGLFELPDPVA